MSSITSYLISTVSALRNPRGAEEMVKEKKVVVANPCLTVPAQVAFMSAIPLAIVETTFSGLAKMFATRLPINQQQHVINEWFDSSSFSVIWAVRSSVVNLFHGYLPDNEKLAIKLFRRETMPAEYRRVFSDI
ncbi:MAG: hypothetical protein PVI40_01910 [Chlamydiota bacterium]|jgi:hypothetical protein